MDDPSKYIMILEDDAVLQSMIREHFTKALEGRAKLLFARSIHEAQILLSNYEVYFFVVDINLPDGDGVDFMCDVKTVDPIAKFIVMTAAPLPGSREKAAGLGAVNFLEKPFEIETLCDVIADELDGHTEEGGESFRGTLKQLCLPDIIQIKCMSNATCIIQIVSSQNITGAIHIIGGEIVHAQTARNLGVDAFNEIISWRGGIFSEHELVDVPGQTIMGHWQGLLLDALRTLDEEKNLNVTNNP
ncbi:response regulator [Kamptonema cortianum]|nr:DUF4388 domain-containing protein [Oscillatoria laete-virens]MDK3161850.1 response regulator [Kamptonema cortianum]MDL5054420.1 response regulator [Oscillatoria laete-virens NRMC-F 0139]